MAELAGPKIGDARSLWNFTPSPGWTKEEAATLRLCLMKFGVGMWAQILGFYDFNSCRTNVNLKDKWRNMNK